MTTSISLKLVVDKKKNRVVFAEADEDFVDILCSFLTLPLGTVVRVLGKQSKIGCVDKLYRSVENLDAKYLQTKACKKMLLEPRSASEILCEDLKLNVDDLKPRRLYRCPTFECFTKTHRLYSSISGARCPCGKAMGSRIVYGRGCNKKDGVFLKGGKKFIISDDLLVSPIHSTESTLSLLQKYRIDDMDTVETKTVDITRHEILKLLGRLLVSSTPLTDVLLPKLGPSKGHNVGVPPCRQPIHITRIKLEEDSSTNAATKSIRVTLLYNKVNKKAVSAQAGEDFVDILFSFLTLPLGCIVKLLDKNSSLGCLDNLYKSIESFGKESDYIKSEECKKLLLAPKLYPYFACSNQLLRIEEKAPRGARAHGCEDCLKGRIKIRTQTACKHNIALVTTTEVNPKQPDSSTEAGGGYAKTSVRFMVTDGMQVTPLSLISGIDAIKESKAAVDSLVEREVSLGEVEVLHLLKACLISRAPLNNVFSTHLSKTKERKASYFKSGIPANRKFTWSNLRRRIRTFLIRKISASLDSKVEFAMALALSSPKHTWV